MRLVIKSLSLLLVLLALLAAALWFSWRGPQPPLPSQQAFVNGHILTMDAENRIAEALLLNGERIEAVGSNAEIRALIDDDATVYDLQGRTLLPGFIDAHGHFPGLGQARLQLDLRQAANWEDIVALVRDAVAVDTTTTTANCSAVVPRFRPQTFESEPT